MSVRLVSLNEVQPVLSQICDSIITMVTKNCLNNANDPSIHLILGLYCSWYIFANHNANLWENQLLLRFILKLGMVITRTQVH